MYNVKFLSHSFVFRKQRQFYSEYYKIIKCLLQIYIDINIDLCIEISYRVLVCIYCKKQLIKAYITCVNFSNNNIYKPFNIKIQQN